ncbi:MAG: SoxR reducing system RseC family protein [Zoogloeaceae bacterium]|nr:SoxR reducing system RseC family protein [Rhodocyclaceae bacterium]MCP5234211.1 SoxR reducing system RseC family protein [Zoogloeaceae bacterium]
MIEVPGEVVAVEQGRALVRTRSGGGGCGRCHESGGCGGARIGSMFRPEQADFWLDNPIQADVGDQVLVCLAEEVSAQAAMLGYLVPVLGIVVGAVIGVIIGGTSGGDGAALAGALGGLVLGIAASRLIGRSRADVQPVLRRPGESRC